MDFVRRAVMLAIAFMMAKAINSDTQYLGDGGIGAQP